MGKLLGQLLSYPSQQSSSNYVMSTRSLAKAGAEHRTPHGLLVAMVASVTILYVAAPRNEQS